MKIISHRGYWKSNSEKNTERAFRRSFSLGFGTETDIRDCRGELVISHDPPMGGEMTFERFLQIFSEYDKNLLLALNVKSDGLQEFLIDHLLRYEIHNYFVFDMSVPDLLLYQRRGVKFYTRMSEIERDAMMLDEAAGVWLDSFYGDWVGEHDLEGLVRADKQVCLVSSELHKRPYLPYWNKLKSTSFSASPKITLCTDLPEDAADFFRDQPEEPCHGH